MVLVGEHVAESSQPCRKGAIHCRITVLEAAYEGCRLKRIGRRVSFLASAIEKAHEYFNEETAVIYERSLQTYSKLPGAEKKFKEFSCANKLGFSDLLIEVRYALIFKGLGFEVEIEPDIGSEETRKIDLKLQKDGEECFVEVTHFRPIPTHEGPPEFNEELCEILPEYGNIEKATEKTAQKIIDKCKQLGSRISIIALWNDDEDLEEIEVEFAVTALIERGSFPEGLQFILYGSNWKVYRSNEGRTKTKQFHCFPVNSQMAPVFHDWIAGLEGHSAKELIRKAYEDLDCELSD